MPILSSTRHPRYTMRLSIPHCARAHHGGTAATHGAITELLCRPVFRCRQARHPRSRPCGRARTPAVRGAIAGAISTCPQTVASKRSVPPHLRPCSLRIRRCRCPRPPWCVRIARWEGSPRREPHRAAPTEAPSSRTERGHLKRTVNSTIIIVHHVALDTTLCTCSSSCVRCDTRCQHRAAVLPRVSPPDPGAAKHGTPLDTMRPRAHTAAVRGAIAGAISDMTPDGGQQAQRASSPPVACAPNTLDPPNTTMSLPTATMACPYRSLGGEPETRPASSTSH